MKQMKINEPKVLKAILNKTKIKDIRKAWEEPIPQVPKKEVCSPDGKFIHTEYTIKPPKLHKEFINKSPKYEINDIVEIIWTGDIGILRNERKEVNPIYYVDERVLAKVKIISREKIEIKKDFERYNNTIGHGNGWEIRFLDWGKDHIIPINDDYFSKTYNLAKEEGFDSVEEMFEWLESYAGDLSTSKPFWLYGLEYIEGGK